MLNVSRNNVRAVRVAHNCTSTSVRVTRADIRHKAPRVRTVVPVAQTAHAPQRWRTADRAVDVLARRRLVVGRTARFDTDTEATVVRPPIAQCRVVREVL
jgi:hypothetical protein